MTFLAFPSLLAPTDLRYRTLWLRGTERREGHIQASDTKTAILLFVCLLPHTTEVRKFLPFLSL